MTYGDKDIRFTVRLNKEEHEKTCADAVRYGYVRGCHKGKANLSLYIRDLIRRPYQSKMSEKDLQAFRNMYRGIVTTGTNINQYVYHLNQQYLLNKAAGIPHVPAKIEPEEQMEMEGYIKEATRQIILMRKTLVKFLKENHKE